MAWRSFVLNGPIEELLFPPSTRNHNSTVESTLVESFKKSHLYTLAWQRVQLTSPQNPREMTKTKQNKSPIDDVDIKVVRRCLHDQRETMRKNTVLWFSEPLTAFPQLSVCDFNFKLVKGQHQKRRRTTPTTIDPVEDEIDVEKECECAQIKATSTKST